MMALLGYILALFMGAVFGALGAGGAILTMPILVYCFNISAVTATRYSLVTVAMSAAIASLQYKKRGHINKKAIVLFAGPAVCAMLLTRLFVVPLLSDTHNHLLMIGFSCLMLLSSALMLKPLKLQPHGKKGLSHDAKSILKLITTSTLIGFISGMVGAGGGFLIIPTLVILFHLPMKEAIGTSLSIVTLNTSIGVAGDLAKGAYFDWSFLLGFLALALSGIYIGTTFSHKLDDAKLKIFFAYLVMAIGIFVMGRELYAYRFFL